jgi:hypothetical protein
VPGLAVYRDLRGQQIAVIRRRIVDRELSYARSLGLVATNSGGIMTFRRSAQLGVLGVLGVVA